MLRCQGLSVLVTSRGAAPAADACGGAPAGRWTLRDVSLALAPGEVLGVAGPSGAGKTTLLRCLSGDVTARRGRVEADGSTPGATGPARQAWHEVVGLVGQEPERQLFAPTVFEDVAFGPRNAGLDEHQAARRADEALAAVGLDPVLFGGRSPFALSGGEMRRAAMAGVIALRPRYLLLDEPLAGLDPEARDRMLALVKHLAETGMGVALVAHDPASLARVCTRVALLADGRLLAEGPAAAVLGDAAFLRGAGLAPGAAADMAARLRGRGLAVGEGVVDADGLAAAVRAVRARGGGGTGAGPREPLPTAAVATGAGLAHEDAGGDAAHVAAAAPTQPAAAGAGAPDDEAPRQAHDAAEASSCPSRDRPAFGRYREGTTLAYRLDPRTKLAFALALVIATFAASGWPEVAVLAGVAALSLAASGVGAREALAQLRPFAWLMAFVLVFNALFASAGIAAGAQALTRFCVALLGTSSLMVTTSPTELTDAARLLARPLAPLGARCDDIALAVGMTLRFVPLVMDELDRVRRAQLARLAPLDEGGPVRRVRAWTSVMVPVLASALRRSRDLAAALDMRGYGMAPQGHRSCLRSYSLGWRDAAVLALSAALVVMGVTL